MKKSKFNRLLALMLAFVLTLGIMPVSSVSVFAAEDGEKIEAESLAVPISIDSLDESVADKTPINPSEASAEPDETPVNARTDLSDASMQALDVRTSGGGISEENCITLSAVAYADNAIFIEETKVRYSEEYSTLDWTKWAVCYVKKMSLPMSLTNIGGYKDNQDNKWKVFINSVWMPEPDDYELQPDDVVNFVYLPVSDNALPED